jgi:chromosome segregation ATPase
MVVQMHPKNEYRQKNILGCQPRLKQMNRIFAGKLNRLPMTKTLIFVIPIAALLGGCGAKEKEMLQTKVDSLTLELETSQQMAQTLTEVGAINVYVKETQKNIDELESSLKNSKSSSNAFSKTIKQLRSDLETKTKEIADLQEQVEKYRNENQNLITTVGMQEAELTDKQTQIETKTQELALIEARVQELMIQGKMSEADAYYARAQAVEEAANRTRLAPRKKKETLREAVELYKKALSLGKNEAQDNITALEKKL